jgi:hypothetical protein
MNESENNREDRNSGTTRRGPRLMERVLRERWAIPGSLRRPLVERLGEIVRDTEAPARDVLAAVSAILAASKINLANIAMTIKVQEVEELKQRIAELERVLEVREANQGGHR